MVVAGGDHYVLGSGPAVTVAARTLLWERVGVIQGDEPGLRREEQDALGPPRERAPPRRSLDLSSCSFAVVVFEVEA